MRHVKRYALGLSAISTGFLLGACVQSDTGSVELSEAALAPDQEVQVLARLAPAAGAREDADYVGVSGEMLSFRSNLSSAERSMVGEVLSEQVALSGGVNVARLEIAYADLNGDGAEEAFVFVKSGPYCGSGDVCNFWMFQETAGGWTQINGDDDAAQALEVLPTQTGGWKDVRIHGQCGREECNFILAKSGALYQWINDPTPVSNG